MTQKDKKELVTESGCMTHSSVLFSLHNIIKFQILQDLSLNTEIDILIYWYKSWHLNKLLCKGLHNKPRVGALLCSFFGYNMGILFIDY